MAARRHRVGSPSQQNAAERRRRSFSRVTKRLAAATLAVSSLTTVENNGVAHAQMFPGMPGMPTEAKPMLKTAKYLECQVCKAATEEMWTQAEAKRSAAPRQHLGEDELQDLASEICDPDVDAGEWIAYLDVTQAERGAPLKLEKQEWLGECRRECRTIQKACRASYDEIREDVAEAMYKRDVASLDKLKSRACQKWARVCPAKHPVPKSYEHPDEFWMPVDEEMYKMKKMQQMINEQANKYGKQPVQFVDPMQSAMFGMDDEDDEL